MTGWYISVGYNDTHGSPDVASALLQAAENICDSPQLIEEEIRRVEGSAAPDSETLALYLRKFQTREDQTVTIDTYPGNAGQLTVKLMASGENPGRAIKALCRRAFCRLVMQRMHSEQMEINLSVG